MAAQPFRCSAAATLRLDRLKHVGHVARVVPRARHDLRAKQVGLPLVVAAVSEERSSKANLRAEGDRLTGHAAKHGPRNLPKNGSDLIGHCLACLRGAVAQRDVANLVREHAGDLAFVPGRLEHSAIDIHRTARQRERIEVAHVDDIERVTELRVPKFVRDVLHEPLTDALDVVVHAVVTKHRKLFGNFACRFASCLYVVLDFVLIFGSDDLGLAEDEGDGCEKRDDCRCRAR